MFYLIANINHAIQAPLLLYYQPQGWDDTWNETYAREYCQEEFDRHAAVGSCGTVPNIDIDEALESCVTDIFVC